MRFAQDATCTECRKIAGKAPAKKEYHAKYRKENSVAWKQYSRDRYDAHKEDNPNHNRENYRLYRDHHLETSRRYYANNTESIKAYIKEWRKLNPGRVAEACAKRKRVARRAVPAWYEKDAIVILYERCAELNEQLGLVGKARLTVDHVIPLNPRDESVCGLHCLANLQLLSRQDNSIKSDSYETDW